MAASSCEDFWQCIDEMKSQIQSAWRIAQLTRQADKEGENSVVTLQHLSRHEIISKLEELTEKLLKDISEGVSPSLKYLNRSSWKNIRYSNGVGLEMLQMGTTTELKFDNASSITKFAATLRILSMCYRLLHEDTYATKRDLYYCDVPFFGNQGVVDEVVENMACMLRVPRHSLRVLASSKGCIAGELRYREYDGTYVDCRSKSSGTLIPSHVQGIYDIFSDAKAVLVVEKEATFLRLLDDGALKTLFPCIIVTGKGFPDVNTRLMLRKLWDTLKVPILALMDGDPHGIEILSVYKFGSKSLSFDASNLTLPVIKWLGVLPQEAQRLPLEKSVLIPLREKDKTKCGELLSRPYMSTETSWKDQIKIMLAQGVKTEIQALSTISPSFLSDTYLPVKIKHGRWI